LDVLFSSGLGSSSDSITKWALQSVDEYYAKIARQNDGTLPLEPYLRISQAVFEAWLAKMCKEGPAIDVRFGWKGEKGEELESGASVIATELKTGKRRKFIARYVAGCDGANSRMRRDLNIPFDGGPMSVLSSIELSRAELVDDSERTFRSNILAVLRSPSSSTSNPATSHGSTAKANSGTSSSPTQQQV